MNPHRPRHEIRPVLQTAWLVLRRNNVPRDLRRVIVRLLHADWWQHNLLEYTRSLHMYFATFAERNWWLSWKTRLIKVHDDLSLHVNRVMDVIPPYNRKWRKHFDLGVAFWY